MDIRLGIVLIYLVGMLVIGLAFRRKSAANNVEFYLAGRSLPPVLIFVAMAATNFSAFTIFGLSGAGYRMGYSFYPVMGFGTGFMALGLFVIGTRIRLLGAARGYVTPSDFVGDRYGSKTLKRIFSLVMIAFTLPYIAIQAVAAGKSLQSLTGLPYFAGAALVTGFVMLYVALGGLRSVAWTDVVQGIMIVGFTLAAYLIIVARSGGFVSAHDDVYRSFPALFSRPGLDGSMLPGVWLGYLVLWLAADPMFPQLFQKSLAAGSARGLKTTAVLYPLITTFLFFLTVSMGVIGRRAFPNLPAAQSDSIFALLLGRYTSPVLGTLLMTAGLAALMSTMDSQLLTLASMVTLDFGRPDSPKRGVVRHRLTAIVIGLAGLAIAARPPQTILDFINKTSFTGLAVLAPTVVGGLFWKRANRWGAAASIAAGELTVLLSGLGIVRTPGLLPVIPALAVAAVVFVLVSLLTRSSGEAPELVFPTRVRPAWVALVFVALFVLANDYWAWGRTPIRLAGVPLWVWYYALLGVLLAVSYAILLRTDSPAPGAIDQSKPLLQPSGR